MLHRCRVVCYALFLCRLLGAPGQTLMHSPSICVFNFVARGANVLVSETDDGFPELIYVLLTYDGTAFARVVLVVCTENLHISVEDWIENIISHLCPLY